MKYATKQAIRQLIIFLFIILIGVSFAFAKPVKPLHTGYYTAKQLTRRGYPCRFKGRVCITYKKYLELLNNKTVIK